MTDEIKLWLPMLEEKFLLKEIGVTFKSRIESNLINVSF